MPETKIPNGAIVKFTNSDEVYLVDAGKLRHFTKEVKMKNDESIFSRMVELDPSYKNQFPEERGKDITGDIPFDAPDPKWGKDLPEKAEDVERKETTDSYEVNRMYQQYFARSADATEMDYWTTRPITELETQLQTDYRNASGHDYDGSPIDTGQTKSRNDLEAAEGLDEGMKYIDDAVARGLIGEDQAALLKMSLEAYDSTEIDAQSIIDTFEKVKTEQLDPHFQGLADLMVADIKESVRTTEEKQALGEERITGERGLVEQKLEEDKALEERLMNESRTRELTVEERNKLEDIRKTRADLEARGMTFQGEAVRELGLLSAVPGTTAEGRIPETHRLIAESSQARHEAEKERLGQAYTQQMRDVAFQAGMGTKELAAGTTATLKRTGARAEEQLGTAGVAGLDLPEYTPVGGVSGVMPTQQQEAYSGYMNQLLAAEREKKQFEQPLDYYS